MGDVQYIDMEIMLCYNTDIYGHSCFLKGLSLVIVYVKSTRLSDILIVSLAIFYNGAKLGNLLTVTVKLCEILLQFCIVP